MLKVFAEDNFSISYKGINEIEYVRTGELTALNKSTRFVFCTHPV